MERGRACTKLARIPLPPPLPPPLAPTPCQRPNNAWKHPLPLLHPRHQCQIQPLHQWHCTATATTVWPESGWPPWGISQWYAGTTWSVPPWSGPWLAAYVDHRRSTPVPSMQPFCPAALVAVTLWTTWGAAGCGLEVMWSMGHCLLQLATLFYGQGWSTRLGNMWSDNRPSASPSSMSQAVWLQPLVPGQQ